MGWGLKSVGTRRDVLVLLLSTKTATSYELWLCIGQSETSHATILCAVSLFSPSFNLLMRINEVWDSKISGAVTWCESHLLDLTGSNNWFQSSQRVQICATLYLFLLFSQLLWSKISMHQELCVSASSKNQTLCYDATCLYPRFSSRSTEEWQHGRSCSIQSQYGEINGQKPTTTL